MNKIAHKIEPQSIRDAIDNDPFIRTIEAQIKHLLETSADPIYVGEDGEVAHNVKGPSGQLVDRLVKKKYIRIAQILKEMGLIDKLKKP